jgi:hypothetical protein
MYFSIPSTKNKLLLQVSSSTARMEKKKQAQKCINHIRFKVLLYINKEIEVDSEIEVVI